MKQIYHKKNELFEVEFYQDKECTIPFDFTNAKDLYVELKDGDCTPIFKLHTLGSFNIFTPYISACISNELKHGLINTYIKTLDDITPNLSKYIPEDNAVLFLSEEDRKQYNKLFLYSKFLTATAKSTLEGLKNKNIVTSNKLTIFLPHGTQSELEKANEIEKELKEKYGVEEVNLFALHCFEKELYELIQNKNGSYTSVRKHKYINKIITTNSTGILPVKNKEHLQVIDCKEIFEEYLKTER